MLNSRLMPWALAAVTFALPAAAQDMQPHRAAYTAFVLDKGKPNGGPPGTYAYELKLTCDSYVMNQRMRLEIEGPRGMVVSEQPAHQPVLDRLPIFEAEFRASLRPPLQQGR